MYTYLQALHNAITNYKKKTFTGFSVIAKISSETLHCLVWIIIWHSEDRGLWHILITKPTRCTNFWNLFLEWSSRCFGQYLCPSSGVQHCTHSNRYMSYRLWWLLASRIL